MNANQDNAFTLGPLEAGPACCDPQPVIQVKNLSLQYGDKTALDKVTLDIYKGCITALIGPSGCGKTSFLSAINRLTDLIPGCNVDGSIFVNDQDIHRSDSNVQALRRQIGMVFQKPTPFPLSIRRNLALPLTEHGISKQKEVSAIIERVLRDVGLWDEVHDRLDASALSLSGGQQQRLCIARALALNPQILLMDEPCSALDPIASGIVEDLICRLQGRYTIVIVTHNLAQARRIANYAAFFWVKERAGQLVEFGRCQHIFESPSHELTAAYVNGVRG
ncbi:MAG TPA: phosphate ABC transporter ATP-binding protein [Nitrosomonas sp.]|uniref:phosphate ABC transporter ATP-binding protein n=1 Tax=Nitrosomonas sp. TaxID=42353 RepID=UPI00208B4CB7|nr:phosphate ABC transporter ATP-binding protein [Nitrosomonas sp.]GJL74704.1 MAG: phosphate ABC transporter ATP-binding protein [Nitrosomonas sp.]HNP26256.1 phosphate ABC transporter ATP-binding protein [Nitrosomonas sp.]